MPSWRGRIEPGRLLRVQILGITFFWSREVEGNDPLLLLGVGTSSLSSLSC